MRTDFWPTGTLARRPPAEDALVAAALFALLVAAPVATVFATRSLTATVTIIGLVGCVLAVRVGFRYPRMIDFRPYVAPVLFHEAALLTVIWSPRDTTALVTWFGIGAALIGLFAADGLMRAGLTAKRASWPLVGVGLLAAVALADLLTGGGIRALFGEPRAPELLNRSLVTAVVLLAPAVAVAAAGRAGPLALPVALLVIAAVALSETQSGMLGLIVAALAGLLAAGAPRFTAALLAVGGAVVFLAMPWIVAALLALDTSAVERLAAAGHADERLEIWRFYAAMALERPWLGYGFDAARFMADALPRDVQLAWGEGQVRQMHPHNLALHVHVEMGLYGVLGLTALWGWFCVLAARQPPITRIAALVTLAAVGAIAMVAHGAFQTWWVTAVGLAAVTLGHAARLERSA